MMRFSYWLLAVIALGAVLTLWSNVASSRDKMSLPDAAASATLSPLQRALKATGNWASDVGKVVVRRDDIASQNERLRQRLADLEGQNERLLRYRHENEELRRLLKMPPPPGGRAVAAEIIYAQSSDLVRRFTLNVGSRQGVAPKDVVYSAEGLVGQVTQVSPFTSVVTLFIDREGAVGAMVSRSGAKGVVRGSGSHLARLEYLDYKADVRTGDTVTTSGLVRERGAVFPKGIVIGRVLSVRKDRAYSRQEVMIEPVVPFERLSAVWVRVAQTNQN